MHASDVPRLLGNRHQPARATLHPLHLLPMSEVYREMMTQEERIELLRQVSAVAPEEMGAVLIQSKKPNAQGVKFSNENGQATGILTLNGDDVFDAEAIIAMLDAMEEAGHVVWLSQHIYCEDPEDDRLDVDGYECSGYRLRGESDNFDGKGETRAEAVARAFVEVFGK